MKKTVMCGEVIRHGRDNVEASRVNEIKKDP